MEFTDRIEEQKVLRRVLSSQISPKFVVVYGRRRLGKSTLIRRVLTDHDIYYMAGNLADQVQRDLLQAQIGENFPDINRGTYSSWEDLLLMLNTLTQEQFTLCLDEFPYMVKNCPELPSILQKIIDTKELKYNLIICGSSQRMMQEMILSPSEPLYGRSQMTLSLQPIPVKYLQETLSLNPVQTIEEWSVWGGVPRYWELREEYEDLHSAIMETMMGTGAVLYDEPKRLFMDDLTQTVQSESLMSIVASGANRISEIAGRIGKEVTTLSTPMDRLIQMGYLRREIPFGDSPKKSKKGIYRINDPLMDFYYTFIVPNQSNIGRGRKKAVMNEIEKGWTRYVSLHWEHLCHEAVSGNFILGHQWGEASRWWGNIPLDKPDEKGNKFRPIELDVVAESTDGKYLLIGECKWTESEYADRLLTQLKAKTENLPIAKGKDVIYCLFLKCRPKDHKTEEIFLPEDVIPMTYGEE